MKKLILSLIVAGTFTMAISACNSTKNVSGTSDSLSVDSTATTPVDTAGKTDTVATPMTPTTPTTPTDTTNKM